MWIPIILVALYTGWILWQRHLSKSAPQAPARDPLAQYGRRVKILQFYAEAAHISPGGHTLLCYGVVNAKAVKLDPPVESVWPALSRCFQVAPAGTTRYTFTAEGAG